MEHSKNHAHHGRFKSETFGDFSVASREFRDWAEDDPNPTYTPELVIYLTSQEQLEQVAVVTPDGNTWRINREFC
jgi:hypothetical protein